MRISLRSVLSLLAIYGLSAPVAAQAQVTPERIERAGAEPQNWLTYGGGYDSKRYSTLNQITPGNVKNLEQKWVLQDQVFGAWESNPLVVDGIMYVTERPNDVIALDAKTGRVFWLYRYTPSPDARVCCGANNRGVAILGDTLFMGTLDAHLIALDAKNGRPLWNIAVADVKLAYSITMAPLVVKDKVIIGVGGAEFGIRGFVAAYDAKTGKEAWRFNTIPGPGEPGHETWSGDDWMQGGASAWITGSFDPSLNLIYWGIGNPGPDWNPDQRPGDNLYSDCVVALDPDTGKLKWHFQFTPHDVHDWDANQIPVLVDTQVGGRARALVVMANRNGFYYALDRKTGEFVFGAPYAKQTWAKGLDARGRPIEIAGMEPSEKGTLVYPSLQGSTNWASPSYSPATDMLYVPVREMGSIYYKTGVEYKPGTYYTGGSEKRLDEESWGAVRALDVKTGKQAWDFRLPTPTWAGVMATAGGLVFSGSNEGNFFALDAKSGKPLWQFQTGGAIRSGPMSYLAGDKQYVAVAGGHALFVFALE